MSKCVKAKPTSRVVVSLSLPSWGYTIDDLVDDLDNRVVADNVSGLLVAGANPDKLVGRLKPPSIVYHLDKLLAAGAKINVDELVGQLSSSSIYYYLDRLLAAGADPDELVSQLEPRQIAYHLDKLLAAGAKIDVDELASRLKNEDVACCLD